MHAAPTHTHIRTYPLNKIENTLLFIYGVLYMFFFEETAISNGIIAISATKIDEIEHRHTDTESVHSTAHTNGKANETEGKSTHDIN